MFIQMAAPAVNVGYGKGEGFKDDPTPGVGEEPGLEPGLQLELIDCSVTHGLVSPFSSGFVAGAL